MGMERTPLTQERILQAAIELVDEQGVDALSMRRLGSVLGVEAMSIYNHIPNKAELLNLIVRRVLSEIELPPPEDDWSERLKKMTRSYRAMALRHPRVVPLIAMRPFGNLPTLPLVEMVFETLDSAGVPPEDAIGVLRTISSYGVGFTLSEVSGLVGGSDTEGTRSTGDVSFDEFPHIMKMVPLIGEIDVDRDFEMGLEIVLAGLRARLTT
jgi:AcrR family transcriptional regulator